MVEVLGDLLAYVARPRVHYHPSDSLRILLHFDEVVPAAERADLTLGLGDLGPQSRHVRDRVEEIGAVRLARRMPVETLGHSPLDFAEDRFANSQELASGDVRAPAAHATADVESDRMRDHPPPCREHSADRHSVADVGVGHERHVVGCEREVGQIARLGQRLLVDGVAPDVDRELFGVDRSHERPPRHSYPCRSRRPES